MCGWVVGGRGDRAHLAACCTSRCISALHRSSSSASTVGPGASTAHCARRDAACSLLYCSSTAAACSCPACSALCSAVLLHRSCCNASAPPTSSAATTATCPAAHATCSGRFWLPRCTGCCGSAPAASMLRVPRQWRHECSLTGCMSGIERKGAGPRTGGRSWRRRSWPPRTTLAWWSARTGRAAAGAPTGPSRAEQPLPRCLCRPRRPAAPASARAAIDQQSSAMAKRINTRIPHATGSTMLDGTCPQWIT